MPTLTTPKAASAVSAVSAAPSARLAVSAVSVCAIVAVTAGLGALSLIAGCNSNEDAYKATPAYSGRKPNLPPVPSLPTTPINVGDAYTVYGAGHQLRSEIHSAEVSGKDISIVGYITRTNLGDAPDCAIHPVGKEDPLTCTAPIPTFWISDTKGDTKGQAMQVLGWARNFAVVYDAVQKYKGLTDPPKTLVNDAQWSVDVPFPLPSVGAKVKVTGTYGYTFPRSSKGMVADPEMGVLSYKHMETLEPPTAPATLTKKGSS
jgi:hypothetical protein